MTYLIILILMIPSLLWSKNAPIFTLSGEMLTDPAQAERVAYILNASFDDLWQDKADVGDDNFNGRRFTVQNLLDKAKLEDNMNAIQSNWDDLWAEKRSIGESDISGRRYTIQDVTDPAKAEENAFAIMENFYDLYKFKEDR